METAAELNIKSGLLPPKFGGNAHTSPPGGRVPVRPALTAALLSNLTECDVMAV